jgi:hypothetical protein
MYTFCIEFYKQLVKGISVIKALELGKEVMKNKMREINKVLKIINFSEK